MPHIITNPRDPLTQRIARTVRETVRNPWDYSEGPTEPQLVDVARSFPNAARIKRARRIDVRAVLGLGSGCHGNCQQGRVPCTLPGTCNIPVGDDELTQPAVPFPAEACTEIGADEPERVDDRRNAEMLAGLLGAALGIFAFAIVVHVVAWVW